MIDITTNIDHTTDAFNKITAVKTNGQNVVHLNDPTGNLIFDGRYVYQYDAWNRLVEVNEANTLVYDPANPATDDFDDDAKIHPAGTHQIGYLVVRFAYDGLGRLIWAQRPVDPEPATPSPACRTEHYYYDGVRRIQEVIQTPGDPTDLFETAHEYVYGPGYVDEFVLESQKSGGAQQDFYVLQDANFNVMALTDASGGVVEQYQWEPYGLLAAKDTNTGGTIPNSHIGHQGLFFYRFDDTAGAPLALNAEGLYFNINRWYDPTLARFTSRDPVETSQLVMDSLATRGQILEAEARAFEPAEYYGDGFNLFSRVGNRPTDRVDALGLDFQDDIDAAINGIKVDHAIAYATTRVAIRRIERGNQLAMAYAAVAFLWDNMVWDEGEGALYSLVLAGLGASACFAEGTSVLMADGTSVPIEEVCVGDRVFCDANPEDDDGPETCAVTRVFTRTVDRTIDLAIASQGEIYTIRTTAEHPFYIPQEARFVPAGVLDLGVSFHGPTGADAVLHSKHLQIQSVTVYNIEVAVAHNYYVAEADSCCWLLVHNECHGHHTVPNMILKRLKAAGNAAYAYVRGARGRPNIWKIPAELHRFIHGGGPDGGRYNARWIERLEQAFGTAWDQVATSDAIMAIRDQLVEEFGLDVWRP